MEAELSGGSPYSVKQHEYDESGRSVMKKKRGRYAHEEVKLHIKSKGKKSPSLD